MTTLAINPAGVLYEMDDIPGLTIKHPLDGHPYITQAFGVWSVTGIRHRGVDNPPPVDASESVRVRSVLPGIVLSTYIYGYEVPGLGTDGSPGGYGNQVTVMHTAEDAGGSQVYSHYAHLARGTTQVFAGDRVQQGQILAHMDDTGISTGRHLHWEMRLFDNATRFDPMPYVDRVVTPPLPPDGSWERFWMDLTPQQQASLIKLADLDINGKTFAPGTPGRSLLIQLMDFYVALPDDEARKKFSRRLDKMMGAMAGPVSGGAPAAKADRKSVV